mmetsp:Transcript_1522/g.6036  ORF Transcript_1522/g.6036 Transcript_1522/m.6036 type:complete len:92 (+) Transcript_1522:270-545(+)
MATPSRKSGLAGAATSPCALLVNASMAFALLRARVPHLLGLPPRQPAVPVSKVLMDKRRLPFEWTGCESCRFSLSGFLWRVMTGTVDETLM